MPVWEQATITESGRVDVEAGNDWVKFLAPQFRLDDGSEYGLIGFGIKTIGESDT